MPAEAPPAPTPSAPTGPPAVAPPVAQPPMPTGPTDAPANATEPFQNAFADLDQLLEQTAMPKQSPKQHRAQLPKNKPPQPPPKRKGPPPPDLSKLPKPNEEQPEEHEPNPDPEVLSEEGKAAEKPEGDKKPADQVPKQPKELRAAYESLKSKSETLEKELATLKAERAKPPAEDPEKKALFDRAQAYEKRLKELDEELKYAAYERTPEYQDRYEKPFIDAYTTGREKVSRLSVIMPDGNTRKATAEDFDRFLQISDDDRAADVASEMFGPAKAPMVLYHREKVQELLNARTRAVEDFRKTGSERFKKAEQDQVANQTKLRELWENENKAVQEKYEWFRSREGDEEGNALLSKGYELVDQGFNGEISRLPLERQVQIHAAIRNRAAAFGRLVHDNKALTAKVAELEKELAQYGESEPGDGEPETPGRGGPKELSWEEELNALAR